MTGALSRIVLSASADIKALETLRYAEHICNYVVISDSWFYGKVSVVGNPSNLGLISLDITGFLMLRILSMYLYFRDTWVSGKKSQPTAILDYV